MEKSWNQLADRCNLFFDAPDGLYKELLKEAECELADKCSLYKNNYTYKIGEDEISNALQLPNDYKSMIGVWVDGNLIKRVEKTQWDFNKGNLYQYPVMTVDTGTPEFYDLANGFLVLNKTPSTSNTIDIYYKATLSSPSNNGIAKPTLIIPRNMGQVYINTSLGAELNGSTVVFEEPGDILSGGGGNVCSDIVYQGLSSNYPSPTQLLDLETGADRFDANSWMVYEASDEEWAREPLQAEQGFIQQGWIRGYSKYAPVIDGDYHLALCDYALYIASAKTNPDLSMKHQQIWEKRIRETLNDNLDKELPIGIKEEI
tara:strand:+ start:1657 stop:2604 length:948 start_codon:yes stop_codon:yes gene_type:complete